MVRKDIEAIISMSDREFDEWYEERKERASNALNFFELFSSIPQAGDSPLWPEANMGTYTIIIDQKNLFKEGLENLEKIKALREKRKTGEDLPESQDFGLNGERDFYHISKERILEVTTPEYRKFLREAGYGDLDSCSRIEIAKGILKYYQSVRDAATRAGLSHTGNDGDYVININHPTAIKLVEALGYKLLTVGLMYKLFIPYIKELVRQRNTEAQATFNEMIDPKAEWLEDIVIDKKKVYIGTKEKKIILPGKDGRFDRADINEYGYPINLKGKGEFHYWFPIKGERAIVRGRDSGFNLDLSWKQSEFAADLGLRLTKIIPVEM